MGRGYRRPDRSARGRCPSYGRSKRMPAQRWTYNKDLEFYVSFAGSHLDATG